MESIILHGVSIEEMRSLIIEEISKAIRSITNEMRKEEEELWTVKEVCDYLKITRQTLSQYDKRNILNGSKMDGKSIRYRKSDVFNYVERCKR